MTFMKLYVIVDKLAEESGPVFEAANDKVARRQYKKMMQDVDETEYQLLRVGRIDHYIQKCVGEDPVDVTKEKLVELQEDEE